MIQFLIAITGGVAIWLTQQGNEELKKYACVFGLIGQPFWFYTSYLNEQWGIFALSVFYAYAWIIGVRNNWLNTNKSNKEGE